jgi:outer membrane lipoprotein-sorting protein
MDTLNIKILIIVLLSLTVSFLYAQEDVFDEIYDNLMENYNKIETYKADLTQENYWKDLDVKKMSYGKIYYNKNFLLLDYSDPAGQKMLINSTSVIIYDSTSCQAFISDKIDIELRPMKFISLYWNNSQKEIIKQEQSCIVIKFITSENEQIFVTIEDFYINELKILDEYNNSVKYLFINEEFNIDLSKSTFEIDLPDDVNIVDNRQ